MKKPKLLSAKERKEKETKLVQEIIHCCEKLGIPPTKSAVHGCCHYLALEWNEHKRVISTIEALARWRGAGHFSDDSEYGYGDPFEALL